MRKWYRVDKNKILQLLGQSAEISNIIVTHVVGWGKFSIVARSKGLSLLIYSQRNQNIYHILQRVEIPYLVWSSASKNLTPRKSSTHTHTHTHTQTHTKHKTTDRTSILWSYKHPKTTTTNTHTHAHTVYTPHVLIHTHIDMCTCIHTRTHKTAELVDSHYIKIIVVRPSVRPSVTEGQRKRFDLETPAAVSRAVVRRKLELGDLCERQSWH